MYLSVRIWGMVRGWLGLIIYLDIYAWPNFPSVNWSCFIRVQGGQSKAMPWSITLVCWEIRNKSDAHSYYQFELDQYVPLRSLCYLCRALTLMSTPSKHTTVLNQNGCLMAGGACAWWLVRQGNERGQVINSSWTDNKTTAFLSTTPVHCQALELRDRTSLWIIIGDYLSMVQNV